ncbi:MAG TPA: hypothetical protein VGF60_21075 [Xanthobacteraceae bacterium]
MRRRDQQPLAERVARAAEAALAAGSGHVGPIDIFMRIGWVDLGTVKRWQRGEIDCLEQAIQTRPERIAEVMRELEAWAREHGFVPSVTSHVARTPRREPLRFTRGGDPALEQLHRTHWISGRLSTAKQARLAEKASRAPELVAIEPLNRDWSCHRCGGSGGLLVMEKPGPSCLPCAGLGDLELVPAGNALLTRRAKAKSPRYAVVVRFSRTRRRYERQGLLVEPRALAEAQREVEERED